MRDLQKLVEEVKSDMKKMGVPYNNNFSVCLRDEGSNNGICYHDLERIDINKGLFEYGDIKDVETVICHELIHSALGFDENLRETILNGIEEKYINMCYTVQTVVGNGGTKLNVIELKILANICVDVVIRL